MSIIEAACCEIISDLKKWKRMMPDLQYQCFQNAYKLFGRNFI